MKALFEYRDLLGYLAGGLTTLAFLPQVLKTLRHRSTKDISLGMYLLLCSGIGLWLLYGLVLSAWPIIISNLVTLILSGTVLTLKIRHR